MSRRPAFYLGPRGLLLGWSGPLGPVFARYASSSRERPEFVCGLGHPGAVLDETPALLVGNEHVAAFWCEEDGAWSARFDLAGNVLRAQHLVLPGARRIALASGRSGSSVLFGADGKGLSSVRIDELGEAAGEPSEHSGETRSAPMLSAVRVRDESLCVAVHRGDSSWTTLALGSGEPKLVRHRHSAPIDDVRVRTVGSRAVVLLGARSRVEMATVSGSGRVIERPHKVFPRGSGDLISPDAVWADDRWVVLAHSPKKEAIVAQALPKKGVSTASGGDRSFLLPKCAGPFSVVYHSHTYYALEVEPVGDDAEMRLWRCSKTGDEQGQRVNIVEHAEAAVARQRRDVRKGLTALSTQMGEVRGYRDGLRNHAQRPSLARDGASIEVLDQLGRLNLSIRPDEGSEALAVRVASALGDDPDLEETPSSLVRLAAWIRDRLSSAARETAEQRLAWATGLAEEIGARVSRVDRAGNTLVLELLLRAMPPPEVLLRWLERVRTEQSDAP